MYVCMCMYMCICAQVPGRPKGYQISLDLPGFAGSCESPDTGAVSVKN